MPPRNKEAYVTPLAIGETVMTVLAWDVELLHGLPPQSLFIVLRHTALLALIFMDPTSVLP